jgi:hypothetical protein
VGNRQNSNRQVGSRRTGSRQVGNRQNRRQNANRHHRHHRHRYGNYGGGDGDGEGRDFDGGDQYEGAPAPVPVEYGVLLTDVARGPAARAGLQPDDIILSFNGQATPSYEALADAVQQSGSEADVYYINADTGARETVTLTGVNGRIGVSGYGVPVDD